MNKESFVLLKKFSGLKESTQSVILNTGVFFFFIIWAFWIYRFGAIAFPRQDHFSLIMDRALFGNDWDYFWNAVSFNKTRTMFPGDYYLFRPFTHGALALIDIFFRHDMYVMGKISIFWHAFVSFFLYLFASKFTRRSIGFLLAFIFATQYPGLEMVIWRHVSPYMLGLLFFTAGLLVIPKLETSVNPKRTAAVIAVLFLVSSLFFEGIIFTLFISFFIFLIFQRSFKGKIRNVAFWMMLIAASVILVYGCLYIFEYIVRNPPSFFGPSDRNARSFLWLDSLYGLCLISGLVFTAFLFPHVVKIFYYQVWYRAWWEFFTTGSNFFYCWLGAFLCVLLAGAFFMGLIRLAKEENKAPPVIFILVFGYFGVIIAGLSLGRAGLRSVDYMINSTYYYYMTAYLLTLIVSLLFYVIRGSNALNRLPVLGKQLLWFFLILFSAHQIFLSYGRIQEVLKTRYDVDEKTAEITLEIASKIRQNRSFCYGGSIDPLLSDYLMDEILYREMCHDSKSTGLYAITHPQGTFWLVRLEDPHPQGVALNLKEGNFEEKDGFVYSLNPGHQLKEGGGIVLSEKDYSLDYLSVTVHNAFDSGIVLGYRDPKNFMFFAVKKGIFYAHLMQNGTLNAPFLAQKLTSAEQFDLSIRKIGTNYVIFYNKNVLAIVRGGFQLTGKVGLYDSKSGPKRQAFSDLKISEFQSGYNSVSPVFRLNLPHMADILKPNKGWAMASNQPVVD